MKANWDPHSDGSSTLAACGQQKITEFLHVFAVDKSLPSMISAFGKTILVLVQGRKICVLQIHFLSPSTVVPALESLFVLFWLPLGYTSCKAAERDVSIESNDFPAGRSLRSYSYQCCWFRAKALMAFETVKENR